MCFQIFRVRMLPELCVQHSSQSFTLCYDLQDQQPDVFMRRMRDATLFDMPQLLACYEYHIALKSLEASHVELIAECMSEQLLSRSWTRIAEGFSRAFQTQASLAAQPRKCECACCQRKRKRWYDKCECKRTFKSLSESRELLPGPMEFLRMAKAKNLSK